MIVKARDLKQGMQIKVERPILGAKRFEVGIVTHFSDSVMFYIHTNTKLHRLNSDPEREFEVVNRKR